MNQHSEPGAVEVPVLEKQILIVEDEKVFARAVQKRLGRAGYASEIAFDLASARRMFSTSQPDLVLLDMRLPDGSGLDFLADINSRPEADCVVLVMSAYGEVDDAVSAMKLGATDYLKKPIDLEELMVNVDKVLSRGELKRKLVYSSKRQQHANESVELMGESPTMKSVRNQVTRISELTQSLDSIPPTVLILGETGTGKDVLARLLHSRSARRDRPFVHVDCASLPKDLIEAELFGHEKGAFTSAHVARTGLIEAAEDGVLFMDEIGELPVTLQAKLLAVLERRTVRRVGTTQERSVQAWFIAATNRDIAALVESGGFRADLYYRLNVLSIAMPPLRARGEDIVLLATHFSHLTARRYGLVDPVFTRPARTAMLEYTWPGNVRELRHVVERAVLLSAGGEIGPEALSLGPQPSDRVERGSPVASAATLEEAEKSMIRQALDRTGGNVSRAARELGTTRMALRYRIKKYHLQEKGSE